MAAHIPPMQALRAFEATARAQSLSRAAEALSLTHGAISHQIKGLEADLGVRLIERAGRGIRLTDAGARFAARVRSALTEIADAVREVSERKNPRHLGVSVLPSFAARWLLPRIGHFIARHPDIDLEVNSNAGLTDFAREDIDVAIRWGLGDWPGVVAEELMDDVYFPVCSPRFARGRVPRAPRELAQHTLLRADDEMWKAWFDAAGLDDWPEPTRGPVFNDSALMLQAAADGQGIALARSSLIGNDLHNGVLVRLFDVVYRGPRKLFLVYPPRTAAAAKVALFRAWLSDEIAVDAKRADLAFLRPSRQVTRTRTPTGKRRAAKH
jgi:LysR family glycine cleavage system transcriptional activator